MPGHREQADNVIRWLGENLKSIEDQTLINPDHFSAFIGAKDKVGVKYILEPLKEKNLIFYAGVVTNSELGLTHKGWNRHKKLIRRNL